MPNSCILLSSCHLHSSALKGTAHKNGQRAANLCIEGITLRSFITGLLAIDASGLVVCLELVIDSKILDHLFFFIALLFFPSEIYLLVPEQHCDTVSKALWLFCCANTT